MVDREDRRDGLLFTRIADGKIVEEWEQFDEVAIFQTIGVNPAAAAQAG